MSGVNDQLKKIQGSLKSKASTVPKPKIKTSNTLGPLLPGTKRTPKPKPKEVKSVMHRGKKWPSMGPHGRDDIQVWDKPGVRLAPPARTPEEIQEIIDAQKARGVTDNNDIYPEPAGLKDWVKFFGPEGSGRARPDEDVIPESLKDTKKGRAIRRGKKK